MPRRDIVALFLAFASMGIMYTPWPQSVQALPGSEADGLEGPDERHPTLFGDSLSLIAGIGYAGFVTCSRWLSTPQKGWEKGLPLGHIAAVMQTAIGFGGLISGIIGFALAAVLDGPENILFSQAEAWFWLCVCIFMHCVYLGLSAIVPRFIPAHELCAIQMLDVIVGTLCVVAVAGDSVTPPTLVAGVCLVTTLVGKEMWVACCETE